ncbi:stage III sporulation protein AA [Ammoniphilus sp. 3BR4]|uniref:stage III sporulation protein AA n=1 Tax=Ammoniphilus sp. 3BR4 TaxID=3158265 RepID=UPI0034661658
MDPYLMSMMPKELRELCRRLPQEVLSSLEEIRIRKEQPVEFIYGQVSRFLSPDGALTHHHAKGWRVLAEQLDKMVNLISQHSIYALEEELKRGYVTVTGGHRIGIVGKALVEKGEVRTIRDISGLNVRIAREKKGVALPLIPYLTEEQLVRNTLIVSPPQCGKTTILRDLARVFSYGNPHMSGKKVSIIDERSELAGSVGGIPQKDVGPRTDILDACPKAEGIMMLIRSMSPDIIIADEIGRPEDAVAIQEALNAGVTVITSVHGASLTDINRRPTISRLIGQGVFQRYVFLGRSRGVGTIERIYNEKFELLSGVT